MPTLQDNSSVFTAYIEQLILRVKRAHIKCPPLSSLKTIIVPHAGYIYSGWAASHISMVLIEKQFKRILVLKRIITSAFMAAPSAKWLVMKPI